MKFEHLKFAFLQLFVTFRARNGLGLLYGLRYYDFA